MTALAAATDIGRAAPRDQFDDDSHEQAPTAPLGRVLKRSELSKLPRVSPLVEGVVSSPATVVLIGEYGVGKTFLALSLANSIGTGHPWLGRTVQRRRVLYVLGEGAYGLDARVNAWESAWGETVSDDDVTFVVQPASLSKSHTWSALKTMALAGGYGFVVLDTFSSLAADADETKDAPRIMRWLAELATAIGGTTLLVHHPGWSDASRARGGYQFEANADEVLIAAKVSKGSDLFTLLRKKVKDGPDGKTLYLRRKAAHGSCIIEETGAELAGAPMAERILAVLTNCGDLGATGPQIRAELEIPESGRSTFQKALRGLRDDGRISTSGSAKSPLYKVTGDGSDT